MAAKIERAAFSPGTIQAGTFKIFRVVLDVGAKLLLDLGVQL